LQMPGYARECEKKEKVLRQPGVAAIQAAVRDRAYGFAAVMRRGVSMRIHFSSNTGIRLAGVISLAACGLMGGLCASACPAATPAGKTSDVKTPAVIALEKAGLKSDNESLLAYLAQRGDPVDTQLLTELVRQLGAEDWKTREEATKKLIAMGAAAREAMEKATTHKDIEVQIRAKLVLEQLKGPDPMSLVLAVIAERKLPGTVPILLRRMPDMGSTGLEAARRALAACASPADIPILRNALKAGKMAAEVRATVLTVLFKVNPRIGQADMDLLKACLAENSTATRRSAMYALSRVPMLDESLVPLLVKVLTGDEADLVSRAASFLGKIGDPSAADALLGVLGKSANSAFRGNVISALVKLKGQEVAGPLIALLAERDTRTNAMVLGALARIHAPEAAEAIIGVLADPSNRVRSQACKLLAGYANRKAVEPLCRIVTSDKDPGVRRVAAFALGRIGDIRAMDSLIKVIPTDKDPDGAAKSNTNHLSRMTTKEKAELYKLEARLQAMTALGMIGGPKAAEALFRATKHSQPRVRGMAIELLAELGDKRAADLAIEGLSNGNYFITKGAVDACEFLDDPRIRQPLLELATSNRNARIPMARCSLGSGSRSGGYYLEAYLRERAMCLLKDRWPKEARPVLLGRLKDSQDLLARRAAEWLADANDRSALPGLIDLLESGGTKYSKVAAGTALCRLKVRAAFGPCLEILQKRQDRTLAAAMGTLAQESFLDELEAELKKPDGLRLAALRVVEHVHKPELADVVVGLLDNSDDKISNAAIIALGGLKNPKSVAPLLERFKAATVATGGGRSVQVRLMAVALGRIGDKSAVEPLLAALKRFRKDSFTVSAIAKALGQIGDARVFEPLVKTVRMCPQAAEGLAMLGDKRAMPCLKAAANVSAYDHSVLAAVAQGIFKLDPSASVEVLDRTMRNNYSDHAKPRVDAVEWLAKVGSKKAIESIRFALTDSSVEVRLAARKALASLKVPLKGPNSIPAP